MGSIRHRARNPVTPVVFEDGFDELRDAFYERLHAERMRLAALNAALAPGEDRPAWIYDELAVRAHQLHGRAAIFEISTVADAADALEQAAIHASMSPTVGDDRPVRTALATLVRLMATVEATSTDGSAHGRSSRP
jgi:HPt (histidine-containing phosphotransfer) domain-containing protein